jgi:hypothetical protein
MNTFVKFMIVGYMPLFALSHLILGDEPAGGLLIEVYTLIGIGLLCLLKPVKQKSSLIFKYMVAGLVTYISMMAVSGIFYGNPNASKALAFLIDAFGDIKFFVMALIFYYLIDNKESFIKLFCTVVVAIAAVNVLFILRDIAVGGTSLHGQFLSVRNGLTVPLGMFDHKVTSAQIMVLGTISSLCLTYNSRYKKIFVALAFLFTLMVFLHVSIKESISALICLIVYFLFINQAVKPLRSALICVAIVGMGLLLTTDNFLSRPLYERVDLFSSIQTVRAVSYTASLDIANSNFPLGSGAGTFMSKSAAQLAYSPYYYWYNIAFLHGGKPGETFFLYDTYWPKVLAQGGWLAFLAFAGTFAFAMAYALYRYIRDPNLPNTFAAFSLVFVFISSLATSMITFDYIAPVLALSLGWLFKSVTQQNTNRTETIGINPNSFHTQNV